jgi:hypothetical protein
MQLLFSSLSSEVLCYQQPFRACNHCHHAEFTKSGFKITPSLGCVTAEGKGRWKGQVKQDGKESVWTYTQQLKTVLLLISKKSVAF